MKAIVADIHYHNHRTHGGEVIDGNNERLRMISGVVRQVARLPNVDEVIVAGDVFDVWNPPPCVVAALMRDIHHVPPPGKPKRWLAMRGNHDMHSADPSDHSMGGLAWTELFEPVEVPRLKDGVWLVPFGHDALATAPPEGTNFVIAHHGIWGNMTPEFLRSTKHARPASDIEAWCKEHGVTGYFAGDWHRRVVHRQSNPIIVQIGALVPASYSDAGSYGYGTVILLNELTGDYQILEIPGPRFHSTDLSSSLPALPTGCVGFARVRKHDATADLTKLGYRVVDVVQGVEAEAESTRVVLESTREEAVHAAYHEWVMRDPALPDDLRERVYQLGTAHLQRASEG